jgi:hypothetical protein
MRRSAASCRSTSEATTGKPVAVILRPAKTSDGTEVVLVREAIDAEPYRIGPR